MFLENTKQKDYELIDSGYGEKLERYGQYLFCRPDKEAMWQKLKDKNIWNKANFKFERNGNKTKWIIQNNMPKSFIVSYFDINFLIKPTSFKHLGLFPEQIINWQWMKDIIKNYKKNNPEKEINVLNLFAYTGGATLACAKEGACVCHVDGSKQSVSWARENANLSNLQEKPIRWIVDDVISFMKREIKRGKKYDAIIMDPPAFGHGPMDELWKIEENFLELMDLCQKILSDNPIFVLINGYTAGYSSVVYENNLKQLVKYFGGKIEKGELLIKEENSDRFLPCGIFARWQKE